MYARYSGVEPWVKSTRDSSAHSQQSNCNFRSALHVYPVREQNRFRSNCFAKDMPLLHENHKSRAVRVLKLVQHFDLPPDRSASGIQASRSRDPGRPVWPLICNNVTEAV